MSEGTWCLEFRMEIDRFTYKFCTRHVFIMVTIKNITVRIAAIIFFKFNVVGICTDELLCSEMFR
jgi:hypothetical protein